MNSKPRQAPPGGVSAVAHTLTANDAATLTLSVAEHGRSRLWMADEWIVEELNQFLRGWGGYFRYGNSARIFDAISQYALERLAGFVAKRHKRSRIWGMRLVTCGSPDNFGLITLCGTVIAPRPFRPWRAPAGRRR